VARQPGPALDWLTANVPAGTTIAVQDAVHFQPHDLARLPYTVTTVPTADLARARETGAQYLITTYAFRIWNPTDASMFKTFREIESYPAVACVWNEVPRRDVTWRDDEPAIAFLESQGAALDSVIVSPPLQIRALGPPPEQAADCRHHNPFPPLMRQLLEEHPHGSAFNSTIFYLEEQRRTVLFQHPPSEVSTRLRLPDDAQLRGAVTLHPSVWRPDAGDGVRFIVEVQAPGGTRERVLDLWTDPKQDPADRRWKPFTIDLRRYAQQEVTIVLRTEPGADGRADMAGWSGLELTP
jgi:hypothetical protein